ncbi:uncharacterized protein LOC120408436 [Mauremys reevesii]|uniref:uncharacterized protein LOC120408436 n=1 Tax=Mauremys reevesii TaxID=260615 RepID=UPI00193F0665|nr:uncharacterized protein LOC120408436 [Mauremys reevesii]XP_039401313.1 uncharacterized protein LOC120408436 [Mauremys reevesii]XP_039401318.1 uncharacterized protein LOC120408436 [Mauremys reevesii]XP_039401326.1 uncharacterized protein LOC120408436 [Mauremys reevesii]
MWLMWLMASRFLGLCPSTGLYEVTCSSNVAYWVDIKERAAMRSLAQHIQHAGLVMVKALTQSSSYSTSRLRAEAKRDFVGILARYLHLPSMMSGHRPQVEGKTLRQDPRSWAGGWGGTAVAWKPGASEKLDPWRNPQGTVSRAGIIRSWGTAYGIGCGWRRLQVGVGLCMWKQQRLSRKSWQTGSKMSWSLRRDFSKAFSLKASEHPASSRVFDCECFG